MPTIPTKYPSFNLTGSTRIAIPVIATGEHVDVPGDIAYGHCRDHGIGMRRDLARIDMQRIKDACAVYENSLEHAALYEFHE